MLKLAQMPINRVTDEERRTSMEKKAFELQETKKKKHIRGEHFHITYIF